MKRVKLVIREFFLDEKVKNDIDMTLKVTFWPKSWHHLGQIGKTGPKFETWELNILNAWNLLTGDIFGQESQKWHWLDTKSYFWPKWWRHLGLIGQMGPELGTWELSKLNAWNLSTEDMFWWESQKLSYTKLHMILYIM